jgi:hypothetical protein
MTKQAYEVDHWGGGAWAVFETADVDRENPVYITYSESAAIDLAAVLNGAAALRLWVSGKSHEKLSG